MLNGTTVVSFNSNILGFNGERCKAMMFHRIEPETQFAVMIVENLIAVCETQFVVMTVDNLIVVRDTSYLRRGKSGMWNT